MKRNAVLIILITVSTLFGNNNNDLAKKVENEEKVVVNLLKRLQHHLPSGSIERAKINAALDTLNYDNGFRYESELIAYKQAVLKLLKNTVLRTI